MSFNDTSFRQILQLIPRKIFNDIVKMCNGEAGSKGFTCWNQFVAMIFAQFTGQKGLRGIENSMLLQQNHLYHLGIKPVSKSTLSYANNKRPAEIYEQLFYALLKHLFAEKRTHKFKFKNPLYSIDSTTISLCLSLFDWAHFRKKKGGVKIHTKFDHSQYIPTFLIVTKAKKHDSAIIKKMTFEAGDIIVFDRAYNDYEYFSNLCAKNIYFVTRLKTNADYIVVSKNDVSQMENINYDKTIKMNGFTAAKNCPDELRIIESYDPDLKKTITILTNNYELSAETIAAIYKERWMIEVFFKTIKQNLKIKSFFGRSENAVLTQIWIVMICYLLLKYLADKSKLGRTIQVIMAVLPTILFDNIILLDWLNIKNKPKPPIIQFSQLELV